MVMNLPANAGHPGLIPGPGRFHRRKAMINLDSVVKARHHSADNGVHSQSYGFSSRSCTDMRVGP